jgi:MFS transporter, AAHS family, 4-hydroxybenzoate transporter
MIDAPGTLAGRPKVTADVGRLLDNGAWNGYQKSVVALVALALLFDGLDSQVLGLAIPALIGDWQVTRADLAPVVAAGLIGMSIGTALGGWVADRIGRKWALIASVALFGSATAASALVDTVAALGVARTIVGLGLGGALPTATAMIAEYTPLRSRSVGIALGMVTIPLGSMLGSLVSAAIIDDLGWRALFAIGGLLPVALAIVFVWAMPESPAYLLRRPQRRPELLRLLARAGHRFEPDVELVGPAVVGSRKPLSALLGAETRNDTMRAWTAFFLTMLALYSVVSWGPAMLASEGFELSFTGSALAAFAFGGIAGSVASGWMIGWLGSRVSQLLLAGGGAAAALVLAAAFTGGPPPSGSVVVFFAVLGFAITGMQNSLYVLSAHLYATAVRGTGVGAALAVGRLGAVASAFTGAMSVDVGGGFAFFAFIAAGLALSVIAAASIGRPVPALFRGVSPTGSASH